MRVHAPLRVTTLRVRHLNSLAAYTARNEDDYPCSVCASYFVTSAVNMNAVYFNAVQSCVEQRCVAVGVDVDVDFDVEVEDEDEFVVVVVVEWGWGWSCSY